MISFNDAANCKVFSSSLGALFLLASSILPGSKESVEEALLSAYGRWRQRPAEEWTLLNAQRDVAVEALARACNRPHELFTVGAIPTDLPEETAPVLALPLLERIVFLMGSVCRFGIEEISKLLKIPSTEIRSARLNAYRMLPQASGMLAQPRTA